MTIEENNKLTCAHCEHRQKPCNGGACVCNASGQLVTLHLGNRDCPKGKHITGPWAKEAAVADLMKLIDAPYDPKEFRPKNWHDFPNVQSAYRRHLQEYVRSLKDTQGLGVGRGIVICGGGKYAVAAIAALLMIRDTGCNLPVEIWRLPTERIEPWMESAVAGQNATFRQAPRRRINEGWPLKTYAVANSAFAEVLYLDADAYPIQDPTRLFDDLPSYVRTGAFFWPDTDQHRLLPAVWATLGLEHQDEPTFESGMLLIDRNKCWRELALADWMNQHGEYYYAIGPRRPTVDAAGWIGQGIYGDKDTYHLAWRMFGSDYGLAQRSYCMVGKAGIHLVNRRAAFVHRFNDKAEGAFNDLIPGEAKYREVVAKLSTAAGQPPAPFVKTTFGRLLEGIKGLAQVAAGVDRATPQQIAERETICKASGPNGGPCPNLRQVGGIISQCTLCGCAIRAKIRLASKKCPAGKW
jgi:hypothetical protein